MLFHLKQFLRLSIFLKLCPAGICRCAHVFVNHNGADYYHSLRGFRGMLRVQGVP
ncbi:MAG: DUF4256 domain-containing protein [Brevefilum fermentans]|uniref:DUF4256 domain-containing protein n=1 Tax=Candidatus Brevifilum fermentans TaxID=1986204 RepID=UPI0012FF7C8C|nr:DUF4256 domain-containing protein [Chloroflexota bacterium]